MPAQRPSQRPLWWLAAALCGALLGAPAASAVEVQKKIAVLEFELQVGPDDKIDRIYFSNSVRTLVAQRLPGFFIMTRENTQELLAVQGKTLADCESGCEVTTGRLLQADYVITGRLSRVGKNLKLALLMYATDGGRIAGSALAAGSDIDGVDAATPKAVEELLMKLAGGAQQAGPIGAAAALSNKVVVNVSSEPSGATILVDGVRRGASPLSLELDPGQHQLELRSEGWLPGTQTLVLRPDRQIESVRVTLVRQTALVSVSANQKASCEAEGESFKVDKNGLQTVKLPVGKVTVTCSADGFAPEVETATVTLGTLARVDVKFGSPIKSSDSAPAGSSDEAPLGTWVLPRSLHFDFGWLETSAQGGAVIRTQGRIFGVMGEMTLTFTNLGPYDENASDFSFDFGVGVAPIHISVFDPYALYRWRENDSANGILAFGLRMSLEDLSLSAELEKNLGRDNLGFGLYLGWNFGQSYDK